MKFKIYQDARGSWRWHLKAKNNRIVADSGEGYSTKSNCQKAVHKIVAHFSTNKI